MAEPHKPTPMSLMNHSEARQLRTVLKEILESNMQFASQMKQAGDRYLQHGMQSKTSYEEMEAAKKIEDKAERREQVLKHYDQSNHHRVESLKANYQMTELAWEYRETVLMQQQQLKGVLDTLDAKYTDLPEIKGIDKMLRQMTEANRMKLDALYPSVKAQSEYFTNDLLNGMEDARTEGQDMILQFNEMSERASTAFREYMSGKPWSAELDALQAEYASFTQSFSARNMEQLVTAKQFYERAGEQCAIAAQALQTIDKVYGRNTKKD